MCQYVVPVVRSGKQGRPLLRTCCQKARLFHYTAQNNSRQPLRWNDALFFETICGKFGIMKIYFCRWHSLPCLELPPLASAPPLPWLLYWIGCGNSRSLYRGQPAGHCYSRPPSGCLFLLWHRAIRDRETKDDKWRLEGAQRRNRGWLKGDWSVMCCHPEKTGLIFLRWLHFYLQSLGIKKNKKTNKQLSSFYPWLFSRILQHCLDWSLHFPSVSRWKYNWMVTFWWMILHNLLA